MLPFTSLPPSTSLAAARLPSSLPGPPPSLTGIGLSKSASCILSTSPRGSLDGLLIKAPCGTIDDHFTIGVGICEGGLRLQSCTISASKELGGVAVVVDGPTSKPSIVGCQLSGGKQTVQWSGGALGRMEGCQISGARQVGLILEHPSTSPTVSGKTFRDCQWGVYINSDVDTAFALGPGNTFANIAQANVGDGRPGQNAAAAGL